MKRLSVAAFLALALATAAHATQETRSAESLAGSAETLAGFEAVDSIVAMTGLHSWRALDNRTLLLWTSPFRPYLVELSHPSHDLRWAHAIGVTQFGSQIHARFDSVQVGGFRYPIDRIYKLSRDQAKELASNW